MRVDVERVSVAPPRRQPAEGRLATRREREEGDRRDAPSGAERGRHRQLEGDGRGARHTAGGHGAGVPGVGRFGDWSRLSLEMQLAMSKM